jgi:hypothetical protein
VNPSSEAWIFLGVCVTALATVIGGLIDTRRKVGEAVELSRPTGNGFAHEVQESLRRIEERQARMEGVLDAHIQQHVEASFRRD